MGAEATCATPSNRAHSDGKAARGQPILQQPVEAPPSQVAHPIGPAANKPVRSFLALSRGCTSRTHSRVGVSHRTSRHANLPRGHATVRHAILTAHPNGCA